MSKILLTGGGTAGHATPNIALMPTLNSDGHEIIYIGTKNGIEKELVEKLSALVESAYSSLNKLKKVESDAARISDNVEKAEAYRDKVIPVMNTLREAVDEMETLTASEYWPLPTYGDMMFRV